MMNIDITSKSAYKLLQQLESDPQLQSVEDTSILNDEQYPIAFESSITNLKDIIPLISAVTILRWIWIERQQEHHSGSSTKNENTKAENCPELSTESNRR